MIDPDQMRQVFWNLLINAAQAMVQRRRDSDSFEKGREALRGATFP